MKIPSTEIYPIDTVLVAMYGATAGKASILKMEACTNQAVCAILPNKEYSSVFLKYSIDTLYDHLVGLSSGSARDNLSQTELKKLKLIMPVTKNEQENLVSILSLIDRKIELNRQINQNLEAMQSNSTTTGLYSLTFRMKRANRISQAGARWSGMKN